MIRSRSVELERSYDASPAEVWELWTTADGIESWWGPEGFGVEVHELDVRPGGKMTYSMMALAEDMKMLMVQQGMPIATNHELFFTEVVACRRLVYRHAVDFIPGVEPYEVKICLQLRPEPGGTRLELTIEAMHDEQWTDRAVAGWRQELDKLNRALKERRS